MNASNSELLGPVPYDWTFDPVVPGSSEHLERVCIEIWDVTKIPIKVATVGTWDTVWVEEFGEGRFDFVGGEDEDFGDCDWIEPSLYPTPYGWEEGRGSDNLRDRLVMLKLEG